MTLLVIKPFTMGRVRYKAGDTIVVSAEKADDLAYQGLVETKTKPRALYRADLNKMVTSAQTKQEESIL
jgi:hypothetical protein